MITIDPDTRMLVGPVRTVKMTKQQVIILQALLASKVKFLSLGALTEILWPGTQECKRSAIHCAVAFLRQRLDYAGFGRDEVFRVPKRGIAMRGAKVGIHKLSPIEKRLAKTLAEKRGSVITHDEIEKTLGVARPKVRVVVMNIRTKLNLRPSAIKAVWNVGYAIA